MSESDSHRKHLINENLSKNIELYNKYTMLLATIFISALTAIGQHNGYFSFLLKSSIVLFSSSLLMTILELTILILRDSLEIDAINYALFKKFSVSQYSSTADVLALLSLGGFILGIATINIFVFTL